MIKQGFIVGLVNLVLGLILGLLWGVMFPSIAQEYQTSAVFRSMIDPLKGLLLIYPFLGGFALAYLWNLLKSNLKGDKMSKAVQFAQIYVVIAVIPTLVLSYAIFQLSFLTLLSGQITGIVSVFIAGLIFAKKK